MRIITTSGSMTAYWCKMGFMLWDEGYDELL